MRILVLTPTFLPALGGAELVILQVFRRLADRHSVSVLTPYLPENLLNHSGRKEYNHLINFGISRYHDRFSFIKIRGHRFSQGLIPPFSLSAVSAIKRAVASFHPDVINVHYVMPTGLAGLFAQQILKVPVVITYNGRDVPGPGIPIFWKYWHRFIGKRCADMTFVSKYCREVIYGSSSSDGNVIYNGVEEALGVSAVEKRELKAKLNLAVNERILFSLQRLDSVKRVDVLIRSMPKILHYHPKTRLIIGGEGPDLNRLKNVANDLNIADRVYFTGFISQDELAVYFAVAELFLFHSTFETFGMVLAEAMNYGKAIVSVDNTAVKEVVDNRRNGVLIPPFDVEGFADAVLDLLTNKERRQKLGNHGILKAQRLFRWDSIVLQYEKVLREAAEGQN